MGDLKLKIYPLGDTISRLEAESFGVKRNLLPCVENNQDGVRIKAVSTFEKRRPKKGEWYLSGDPILAWKAPNDLSMPYHICRLVKVMRETVVHERIIDDPLRHVGVSQ